MGIKIGQTVGANKTGGKCLKEWVKGDIYVTVSG